MRSRDDSRPLYRRVADDLAEKINSQELRPGDKLPSERALCDQYSVSQITVRRALRELAHADRVYSHHGLGWFVSETSAADPTAHVALLLSEMDDLSAYLLQDLSGRLDREQLTLYPAFGSCDERAEARLIQSAMRDDTAAILLTVCGEGQSARERYRRLLADLDRPGILLMHQVEGVDAPLVALDEHTAMSKLTRHLIQQGHRRIAYAGSDPTLISGEQRYLGFASTLWEHGLELPLDWAFSTDLASGPDRERFRRVIRAPYAPSALVCSSNLRAAQALSIMREAGVSCPDGLALVALEDQEFAQYLTPALTTFRFDRNRLCQAVEEVTLAVIHGTPARSIIVSGELIVRESCGGSAELFPES